VRPGSRYRAPLVGLALAAAAVLAAPQAARAQLVEPTQPRPEFRLDLRPFDTAELGVGVAVPTTLYLRVGALISGGARRDGDSTRAIGRIEGFVRIPFDPLYERRWAPTVTAGGALECTAERRCSPLIVLRLGLEGPRATSGWTPAVEAGVGGGLRVAVVLRRANGPGR
jgi:hypothetical protein